MINQIVVVGTDGTLSYIQPERYPGGELRLPQIPQGPALSVRAQLESSDDIMALMLLAEYYQNLGGVMPHLMMPYIPYARQDRRSSADNNATLSIKAFSWLINAMKWSTVTVSDPHSGVSTSLIDRVVVVDRAEYVDNFIRRMLKEDVELKDVVLVAPDLGAVKATQQIAHKYGIQTVLYAQKNRNEATGEIGPMTISGGSAICGKHILVCDDICDGGGTFAGLAEAVASYMPASLNLYVTHGILSKGLKPLSAYSRIYTPFPFNGYALQRAPEYTPDYTIFSDQDIPPYTSLYFRRK